MTPIAIVGMGAVFPGAGTARKFWHNIRAGVDAVTEVPPHRWDPQIYYDPERSPGEDRLYCRRGGFVDDVATFDPVRFGITPAAVDGIEPDQLLALRTAAEAIADAGGEDRLPDRSRVGVILGRGGYITPGTARFDQRMHTSHQLVAVLEDLVPGLEADRLEEIRRAFCERLGPDLPDAPDGLLPGLAAARVAARFDLRGPAYTVDAACASALLAVEHAVRALRCGQCDVVLAGAVHHAHHVTVWSLLSRLRMLSPSERIRPFDRSADGTLLAEGTGMVLLKRLEDAQRAGDRVYAVIRGVGGSSDGHAAALLDPLTDGQELAVRRAWRDAGLDPRDPAALGLVEAHGVGTPTGDAAEVQTLRRVFGTGGPPVALGTVKSMIGHAMSAGGIAGLIKAAFALHEGVLPPTLHVTEPHPALEGTRFHLLGEAAEWRSEPGVPRRAAVDAFGFGGVNAHIVLEEAPSSVRARLNRRPRPAGTGPFGDVLRLAAASPEELTELLAESDETLLAAAGEVIGQGPCRLAVATPTPQRLSLARTIVAHGAPWRGRGDIWFTPRPLLASGGRLAFLFPAFEPVFRPRIEGVAEHFGLSGPVLTGRDDLVGHAADVIAVGRLLTDALAGLGIEPDLAAGHGLGEWAALLATGSYSQDTVETFLAVLAQQPMSVPDLIYGALGCGAARAAEAVAGLEGVTVSHDNGPHQSVICGPPGTVREVLRALAAEGVLGQELPLRSGLHTPMAAGCLEAVRAAFAALPVERPAVPLWSAATVAPLPHHPEEIRDLFVRHLLAPVRFGGLVERLYTEAGVRAFVQVGPGGLTGFTADALGSREHLAIAAAVPSREGLQQLGCVAAALWVDGYGADRPATTAPAEPAESTGPWGVRLDLGTPLVRLKDAVPPLTVPAAQPPALPADSPIMAEFDALMRDTMAGARTVLEALSAEPGRALPQGSQPTADPQPAALGATARTSPAGDSPSRHPAIPKPAVAERTLSGPVASPPQDEEPETRLPAGGEAAVAEPAVSERTASDAAVSDAQDHRSEARRFAGEESAALEWTSSDPVASPSREHEPEAWRPAGEQAAAEPVPPEQAVPEPVACEDQDPEARWPAGEQAAVAEPAASRAQEERSEARRPAREEPAESEDRQSAAPQAEGTQPLAEGASELRARIRRRTDPKGDAPEPDAEMNRSVVFSLETMPYVADHCLIPQRSGWPDPGDRFPVVPLATLLEVMAEAARRLLPGRIVTGAVDVRMLRWAVAAPPTTTTVHARQITPGRVDVRIADYAEGTILLADRYPTAPEPDRTPLTGEGPSAVSAERYYAERWTFHGPRYQGVREIHALATDGLRGGLVALSTPGALLDSAGQLCGHWLQVYGDRDQMVIPIGIDRVTWYGPHPPEGEPLDVTVRNRSLSDAALRCDVELVGADGTLCGRVKGWTARRVYTDEQVWRMRFTPELSGVGEPQPGGWCLARRHWNGEPARDLLMRQYLGAAERAEYGGLPEEARDSWLLGRIAAKDAVRHWLWEQGHGPLFPAELTVRADAAGRFEVSGPFGTGPAVSVAQTAELGAALVRPAPQPAGIDVRAVTAEAGTLEEVALTRTERVLLERLAGPVDTDRLTAATRLWTAKQAAARATGATGGDRTHDFVVTAADGDRLLVASGDAVMTVESRLVDGHVVTWTVAGWDDAEQ